MTHNPIYLKTTDGACGLLSSHFFGHPALPASMPWPTYRPEDADEAWQEPLDFICQVEYERGLLLFFANIAYYAGWDAEPAIFCHVSETEVVRVVFIPEEELTGLVSRDDAEPLAEACPIEFSTERLPLGEGEHHLFGEPEFREWEDRIRAIVLST